MGAKATAGVAGMGWVVAFGEAVFNLVTAFVDVVFDFVRSVFAIDKAPRQVDEVMRPPFHFNCRCVILPVETEPTDKELVDQLIESVFKENI